MSEFTLAPTGAAAPPAVSVRRRRRLRVLLAAALLVLALVLRLAYVAATPGYVVTGDARDYDGHARSIAAGHGFSKRLAYGRPTAFRPPAYPYFLAGVYRVAGVGEAPATRRIHAARVAQTFVGTAVAALVGLLAWQVAGTAVGLTALGLAALFVPLITVGGAVMSEPLFAVFMLGSLSAALQVRRARRGRLGWVLLAGVLAGLEILTRANAIVLLAPLALAAWGGRPRFSRGALWPPVVLCLVAALTVAPWTARNERELHRFIPVSTQLGSALAGTYNDRARADTRDPASWRAIFHVPAFQGLYARIRTTNEADLERKLRAASFTYIRAHPGYVGTVAYWNTVRTLDLSGLRHSRATAAVIGIDRRWADRGVACFWLVGGLALCGCFTRCARRTPGYVWAVPVLMLLSVIFLVVETPRYRTPIDPFVIVLAAMALVSLATRLTRIAR